VGDASAVIPAKAGIQYAAAARSIGGALEYWIIRFRLSLMMSQQEPRRTMAVENATIFRRYRVMKISAALFALAVLAVASTSPANAKGCLKGAVVGGVAGHYAGHHGVLGALAGCAYGRHRAKEQERQPKGPPPAVQEKI
jgi:uncharacterized membrane protein